jgi:transposase InsO family protein
LTLQPAGADLGADPLGSRRSWKTRIELANAIFDDIEIVHDRQRRHSALGMRTPVEFENTPPEPITAA